MPDDLLKLAASRGSTQPRGIYSVCSAHPYVLTAAMRQAKDDESSLLIEATSNQVNHLGGYTGMNPSAFRKFVQELAKKNAFNPSRLILGGDHLGPNPWRRLPAEEAMRNAVMTIREYSAAGFTKLHLDASMACAGDASPLTDELVASRAAILCQAAEDATQPRGTRHVYVIGTEVPTPGGAAQELAEIEITSKRDAARALTVHRDALRKSGLEAVWPRVIALVVQPGVEFDNRKVVDYESGRATELRDLLREETGLVFEAHSTDYQKPQAYRELVRDGFAILKVGPALTFAMREALYALAMIEAELINSDRVSRLRQVIETVMLAKPEHWLPYYGRDPREQAMLRVYSYSDRIRYYWGEPEIVSAVDRLMCNLNRASVPETLWSQFFPIQYSRIRSRDLSPTPEAILLDKIRDVLRPYADACGQRKSRST